MKFGPGRSHEDSRMSEEPQPPLLPLDQLLLLFPNFSLINLMNLFYFFLSNLKLIIIFIFRETPELNHHFNLEDDSDEEEDLAESIDVSPFYYGLHLHAQLFVGGFFSLLIPVVIMSLFE